MDNNGRRLDRIVKRAVDVVVAGVTLLLLLPLLVVLTLAVKLDSRGPVFHRGWRAGRQGREFRLVRLRTMRAGAHRHGPPLTTSDDPRVTRVGRWLRAARELAEEHLEAGRVAGRLLADLGLA